MLVLPGDPQAAGGVDRPLTPLEAAAPLAGRVLLASAAFVFGAFAADPWPRDRVSTPARSALRQVSSEPLESEPIAPAPWGGRTPAPESAPAAPAQPVAPAPPAAPAPVEPASVPPSASLLVPVVGIARERIADTFLERRGLRRHHALDIMAPRGTRVVAAVDGEVAKMYRHPLGGISLYQYDAGRRYSYYYAHLDAYAPGLREGMVLKRGDPVGFVGTTGNAPASAPHLHFAVIELGPERKWWKGTPVNPLPLFE